MIGDPPSFCPSDRLNCEMSPIANAPHLAGTSVMRPIPDGGPPISRVNYLVERNI
jgi:hypothetical protein